MPWPGSDSTQTYPSDCFTIPYTVDSPRPVPLPTSLVVKNGSNTWLAVSVHAVPIVADGEQGERPGTVPHFGVQRRLALAELDGRRFDHDPATAWHGVARVEDEVEQHLLEASAIGEYGAERREAQIQHNGVTERAAQDGLEVADDRVEIQGHRLETCRRLNARSWAVMAAERSAASRMSSISARTSDGRSPWVSTNSEQPRTTDIMLFTSCAIPPASLPTDSIRCACWRRSSVRRRSVTSRCEPQARTIRPSWTIPNRLLTK